MAERGGSREDRELVFCHACREEWYRDEHGLQCPQCESESVEIIENNNDPRHDHAADFPAPPSPPQHPFHNHNPWDHPHRHHHHLDDPGDPEEGDISRHEFTRNGMTFRSTTYTSPPITMGGPGGAQANNMLSLVSHLLGPLGGPPMPGGPPRSGSPRQPGPPGQNAGPPGGDFRFGLTSPLQEGPSRNGHTRTFTASVGLHPRAGGNGPQTATFPFEDLHGQVPILIVVLRNRPRRRANPIARLISTILGPNTPAAAAGFPAFLTRILDPTNAQHGDAVYSQEALDRVITQLMEQHRGSTAPGPASPAAIAALPKVPVDKSMMGDNGKAECSVCMDNVNVGDEVTMLPCKHWFHGECVEAWLNEHDTCPHCRQSITPKEGNREEPRSSEQAPLHSPSWPAASRGQEAAAQQPQGSNQSRQGSTSGQAYSTGVERPERDRPLTSGSQGRRGSREDGGGGSGGLAGWFRRMGGGGSGH